MADRKIFISDSPKNPHVKHSPFDWSFVNNVTYKFGKVGVPYIQYCPPGTRLKIKPTFAFKLAPLVYPVQTNVRAHMKFYKVPLRILWENWEDFQSMIGTNGLPTNGGGTQFVVPYIKRPTGWNALGSLAEQIGCSNLRLINVNSTTTFPAQRSVISIDISIPFTSGISTSLQCLDIKFGNRFHLNEPLERQENFTFNCLHSTGELPLSGSLSIQCLCKDSSGKLKSFGNPVLLPYSNGGVETSYYTLGVRSSVSFDGFSIYSTPILLFLKDVNFIKMVNNLVDSGVEVVLRLSASGAIASYLFPMVGGSEFSQLRTIITYPTKFNEADGSIDNSQFVTSIQNRLGLVSSASIYVSSTGTQIDTKFDSIDNADPVEPICALPFRALEFIHNYFMRNPRIDPFVLNGNPSYNKFLTNTASGADSTTPVESWNARYEDDFFTTCVKEPQFGNAPLVGVTVNDLGDKGILRFSDGENSANDYFVEVPLDENGAALPITMYKEIADKPNIARLQELINFGISINDLRNVSTFQRMLERMQRTGHRYANVVYEFFGTNPPVGDHYPRYIGGCTRNISVDEITNVALSENAKLGEFAGRASFSGQGKTINCFCSEASYVIGIIYFTVTPTYSQYLPPHLTYKHPLDFYLNPDFAYMGPQPVRKLFVAPNQLSEEHINDIFGYNRPYAELTSRVDEVHGLFKTDMANFLLQRMFGDAPELNKSFIDINANDLLNIFSVTENTDKIWGQVYFKVKANLPFPRSYAPRTV